MRNQDQVRPLYKDLQGYLSQLPLPDEKNDTLYKEKEDVWNNYNALIDELNNATGKNYSNFKINVRHDGDWGPTVDLVTLRTCLGRLISRLHAEYFDNEPIPFGGSPSTVITQTQSQEQNIDIRFYIDLGSKIDEKLKSVTDEKEKGFLQKFKDILPTLKSGMDILKASVDLAREFGLATDQLSNLLH